MTRVWTERPRPPRAGGTPAARVLVIADTDPRLGSLAGRAAGAGAAVLRRPGPVVVPYPPGDEELAAALGRVLGPDREADVFVCGLAPPPADPPGWADDCGESGVGFLVRVRAGRAEAGRAVARARAELFAQAANLLTYPRARAAVVAGRLRLHAWPDPIGGGPVYRYVAGGEWVPVSTAEGL